MLRILLIVVLAPLTAGAAIQAAPAASASDRVCELLSPDDVNGVQHTSLKERKASQQRAKGLHFSQCFYATDDFIRSISLTVITGDASSPKRSTARGYWDETFNPQRNFGRKNAPRAVEGLGRAAYWTSDGRAGVLYILMNDAILRLSVGGVTSQDERFARTKMLAEAIVNRLN